MLRREFLASTLLAPMMSYEGPFGDHRKVALFTDHLAGFQIKEVANMLNQLGVIGPDLTVRPGGLVDPRRAAEELPKAAKIFAERGLTIPMITTAITSIRSPGCQAILSTAARLGIRYYKLGYFGYQDLQQWEKRLQIVSRQLQELVQLNRQLKIQAGFHNHAGPFLGGALWDSWELLKFLDPSWIGFYFDPGQATIEGGKSAWELGFHRLSTRLKMIAIKDFVWEKTDGIWQTRWVPLGQGMVRWPAFFRLLSRMEFQGPLSLHIEYDPGGSTKSDRFDKSLQAAERDLNFLKNQLKLVTPA